MWLVATGWDSTFLDILAESPGMRRHYPGHEEGGDPVQSGECSSQREQQGKAKGSVCLLIGLVTKKESREVYGGCAWQALSH